MLMPDGTFVVRMSPEFKEWVYSEGWRTFCERTGKKKDAALC
jgi:hypothetical protein